ncbi:ribosome biogenesis GTPase YqeH [Pseudothermotoga thermarum]|uniref:Ribosome biogenesis GTPase YqeH n=1 Tax=Pseudothermotoga thermarum DSM 5069 TaxID=688269 RepID=F7YX92_9THEM|nr:ribosome biogenesis GTPase YqeH [Pseudothermotoga thermarum]AEH51280.1 ribosome biogenesis GTPase YqeH [Pseudothermotoga thermarum DSM 5069]
MKCPGCGVELQHDDEYKPGYIPLEAFKKRKAEGKEILCQRCFWLKHYRKVKPVRIDQNVLESLEKVVKESELVVWIIDISDFEGSYDERIKKLLARKKVALVVNKIDLIPKAVKIDEIRSWLKTCVNVDDFEKIFLLSAEKNYGINSLYRFLEKFNKVCFVGVTNVGKSSIFNKLSGKKATVTSLPGTTLDIISAKLKDSQTKIFDTPGLITSQRLMDFLPVECQAEIWAVKKLSRMTFKPDKDNVLFVGGMCVFEFDFEGPFRPIFQFFASEKVKFHLTNITKKDQIWEKHYGKMLVPPCKSSQPSKEKVKWVERFFDLDIGQELSIAGLGWLSVRRGPFKVKVTLPETVLVKKRNALVNPYRNLRKEEQI